MSEASAKLKILIRIIYVEIFQTIFLFGPFSLFIYSQFHELIR